MSICWGDIEDDSKRKMVALCPYTFYRTNSMHIMHSVMKEMWKLFQVPILHSELHSGMRSMIPSPVHQRKLWEHWHCITHWIPWAVRPHPYILIPIQTAVGLWKVAFMWRFNGNSFPLQWFQLTRMYSHLYLLIHFDCKSFSCWVLGLPQT